MLKLVESMFVRFPRPKKYAKTPVDYDAINHCIIGLNQMKK